MTPTEDLSEVHIQDVPPIVAPEFTHGQLNDILRRFDAEHLEEEEGGPQASNHAARVKHWLRHSNGTERGRKILCYLIQEAGLDPDQVEELREVLAGSRFKLGEDDEGNLQVYLRVTATVESQVESQRAYIEEHAPGAVLGSLEDAEEELLDGEWDDALHNGRRALESFVPQGSTYNNALQELVSKDLIEDEERADGPVAGKEMLYTPYGYCSTVGSHTNSEDDGATQLEAETGVVLVGEAIYFLLRKGEEAAQRGIELENWEM